MMTPERATHLAELYTVNTRALSDDCYAVAAQALRATDDPERQRIRVARGLARVLDSSEARKALITPAIAQACSRWELAGLWLVKARELAEFNESADTVAESSCPKCHRVHAWEYGTPCAAV